MCRKEDDGGVSPRFLSHGLCLMNGRVKDWPFLGFAIGPWCVFVCVAAKGTSTSFASHLVISKVIYGFRKSPEAPCPKQTLTWDGARVEHNVTPMYFLCQRAVGRSHPKSRCLRNERISEVVHRPPGQTPELISFISSSCWPGVVGGGRWAGIRRCYPHFHLLVLFLPPFGIFAPAEPVASGRWWLSLTLALPLFLLSNGSLCTLPPALL